jgi:hypothetical protein
LKSLSERNLVIVYLVDGARPDVIRKLLDSGDLPNTRREIVEPGVFRTATSCFTSTTGPAYLPFLMGCFPGTVDIPGIRWLDKKEFSTKKIGKYRLRSYNGIEGPWFNDDLPSERPNLHELFDNSYNIYSPVSRGLPSRRDLTRYTKPFMYTSAHMTDHWHKVDAAGHRKLVKCLEHGDPDMVFTVFPAVDSFSHLRDPEHIETMTAYRNVDASIGETVEILKRQGRWQNTLLVITSDHGLTSTHTHFDLAFFFKKRGLRTLYYPIIWTSEPEVSVMISGNAMGHVYLFRKHPDRPLRGDEVPEELGSLLDELLDREEVDFLAWRGADGECVVRSGTGIARIIESREGLQYRTESGDPFGLGDMATPLDRQEALDATLDSRYPDSLLQICQNFSSRRTGDLIVVSRNGYDLRKAWEWPEHHGSHGSLCTEHMTVPLILNRRDWNERAARTVDLFPSLLQWAGRDIPGDIDGRTLI